MTHPTDQRKAAITAPAVPQQTVDALSKLRSYFGKPVGITMQELGRDAYIDLSLKVRIGDLIDYDEAIASLGHTATEDSLPCVSCGKPADTATEDDADMCWPCMAGFLSAEYGNLRKRFEELIQRDYPHADVEEALDPCRPLPTLLDQQHTQETRAP